MAMPRNATTALRTLARAGRTPTTPTAARAFSPTPPPQPLPPHLLTLADLSPSQIQAILSHSAHLKSTLKSHNAALLSGAASHADATSPIQQTLRNKTVAIMFSKRSTRTRVASETSVAALGGQPMFLGPQDIQLGVNESLFDTAKVVSSMADGIMARVGGHDEIELLAQHSTVPVINALSALYHPTQILADLLTLLEVYPTSSFSSSTTTTSPLSSLAGLKVAWVGDSNNILNDMLVSFPRLGIHLSVATPRGYERDDGVWGTMQDGIAAERQRGGSGSGSVAVAGVEWSNDPLRAVRDADVIVTDTWISMGDEGSKAQRLRDFEGFQVTEDMARRGGAKPDWKFMHCLPRKAEEVDDDVFYSDRSVVFPEAENRKWTIMALFDLMFGRWKL